MCERTRHISLLETLVLGNQEHIYQVKLPYTEMTVALLPDSLETSILGSNGQALLRVTTERWGTPIQTDTVLMRKELFDKLVAEIETSYAKIRSTVFKVTMDGEEIDYDIGFLAKAEAVLTRDVYNLLVRKTIEFAVKYPERVIECGTLEDVKYELNVRLELREDIAFNPSHYYRHSGGPATVEKLP